MGSIVPRFWLGIDGCRFDRYCYRMELRGLTTKMPVRLSEAGEAVYSSPSGWVPSDDAGTVGPHDTPDPLNSCLGRSVALRFTGERFCVRCGRPTNKLFGEGFCYPCFRDAPEASECIVKPELCEAHLGRGRDPDWEEEHHNRPHAVYLAITSAIKVGVTRQIQIPVRWIDQGAALAVQIARTPYRQLAGRIEVALKELFTDRTAWQRMLKNETLPAGDVDRALEGIPGSLLPVLSGELRTYLFSREEVRTVSITYPVLEYPRTVKSVNLEKETEISGTLTGIRGQYLIFDGGRVMNMRRHSGLVIAFTVW